MAKSIMNTRSTVLSPPNNNVYSQCFPIDIRTHQCSVIA